MKPPFRYVVQSQPFVRCFVPEALGVGFALTATRRTTDLEPRPIQERTKKFIRKIFNDRPFAGARPQTRVRLCHLIASPPPPRILTRSSTFSGTLTRAGSDGPWACLRGSPWLNLSAIGSMYGCTSKLPAGAVTANTTTWRQAQRIGSGKRPQGDQSCMRIILNMTQVPTWNLHGGRSEEAQMINYRKLTDMYASKASSEKQANRPRDLQDS